MDKTRIIEKIVTSPQSLSEEEILAICADDELRDIYEGATLISSALVDVPDFDTERSYAQLNAKIQSKSRFRRFTLRSFGISAGRKAAVTIGIMLTAMVVIAAIYLMPSSDRATVDPIVETSDTTVNRLPLPTESSDTKLCYDDAPLSQILDDVAARYGCKVKYINDAVCSSRFHITIPAEASLQQVADMLNVFDEVKITIDGDTIIVE